MIPLMDSYLKDQIQQKITFIKVHPELIDKLFGSLSSRETLKSFKDFVMNRNLKVLLGFPREQQSLPCFPIMLAGEQEVPIGLGDNIDDYEEDEVDPEDITTQYALAGTYMKATFRIECWSDNGDLTTYMYTLLKWCILSMRHNMSENGLVDISVSAGDLEPVPDYFPTFVYRRALMVTFSYENLFFETELPLGEAPSQIPKDTNPDSIIYKPEYTD